MPRRRFIAKREVTPDPKYTSMTVARLINVVMKDGKKGVAERIVYGAFDQIAKKEKAGVLEVLDKALSHVSPMVQVKSRRVGGATYQVPVEVRPARGVALAMRWLVSAARNRREKGMGMRLANEILDAADHRGEAVKKREDTHRMAEANKAFAHYRW
jgi:small subunit ribosomal protein S7